MIAASVNGAANAGIAALSLFYAPSHKLSALGSSGGHAIYEVCPKSSCSTLKKFICQLSDTWIWPPSKYGHLQTLAAFPETLDPLQFFPLGHPFRRSFATFYELLQHFYQFHKKLHVAPLLRLFVAINLYKYKRLVAKEGRASNSALSYNSSARTRCQSGSFEWKEWERESSDATSSPTFLLALCPNLWNGPS